MFRPSIFTEQTTAKRKDATTKKSNGQEVSKAENNKTSESYHSESEADAYDPEDNFVLVEPPRVIYSPPKEPVITSKTPVDSESQESLPQLPTANSATAALSPAMLVTQKNNQYAF